MDQSYYWNLKQKSNCGEDNYADRKRLKKSSENQGIWSSTMSQSDMERAVFPSTSNYCPAGQSTVQIYEEAVNENLNLNTKTGTKYNEIDGQSTDSSKDPLTSTEKALMQIYDDTSCNSLVKNVDDNAQFNLSENLSLQKVATANSSIQKSRSPLADVSGTIMNNYVTPANQLVAANQSSCLKKVSIVQSESFFLYKNRMSKAYTGPDNFNKLSDEMILSVFKWLPKKTLIRCSTVCHRFNRLTQDEALWTRLDLAGRNLKIGAMGNILQRGVIIMRLSQTRIAEIFEPIPLLEPIPSKLQYLDLSMAIITPTVLAELLSYCRNLKKLSLEHVVVNDAVCQEIAANQMLEALNLAMCEGLDHTHSISMLMFNLKSLQSLNISWTNLSLNSVTTFVETVPVNLLRLNVSGWRKSLLDIHVDKLTSRCQSLIELDLSDSISLTAESLKYINKLNQLEYLSLSRCYNIGPTYYLTIAGMKTLQFLDIFGVLSEPALAAMQEQFPSIGFNKFIHSSVARPTVGTRRTSIWGLRTRD